MKKILLFLLAVVLLAQSFCVSAEGFAVLSVGSRGQQVLEVKQRLRDLKYIRESSLTKKYTEKTADSVRLFQRLNGLPETGEVDEATYAVLFSEAAAWGGYPPPGSLAKSFSKTYSRFTSAPHPQPFANGRDMQFPPLTCVNR